MLVLPLVLILELVRFQNSLISLESTAKKEISFTDNGSTTIINGKNETTQDGVTITGNTDINGNLDLTGGASTFKD